MAGLSDLLHLSGNGLNAYQSQIQVFGNNVANVNTDGYSRRSLDLEAAPDYNSVGAGVRTGDVTRLYNALGRTALLQEQSNTSYHSELASYLSELESLVGSGGGAGFDRALVDFQDALQDAITMPEDLTVRTTLLQRASSMASELNKLDARIEGALANDGMLGSPEPIVGEINSLTTQLQALNRNITQAELTGKSVPGLLDQRDSLVRDLSQLTNVTVGADYRISLGGQELVSADGLSRVDLVVDASNLFTIGGVDVSGSVTGGKLAAFLSAQATAETLGSQLDMLAGTIISDVNAVFDTAYNLNGQRPVDVGYTFFTGTDAGDIAIDTALYNPASPMDAQPALVALGGLAYAGDNTAAQALFDLMQVPSAALGDRSISAYWLQCETTLGGAVRESQQLAENGQALVDSLDNDMLSVSGVNMDEELMNLMNAQKAYQACARVMSTASDLLDEVINLTR